MTGDISFFRKRFLGGFNREDVVDYIEKLTQERNRLREAKDTSEQDILLLAEELNSLRQEIEEARRAEYEERKQKIDSVAAVLQAFTQIETSLTAMNIELHALTERARNELGEARATIARLPEMLDQADDRFAQLLSLFGTVEGDFGAAYDTGDGAASIADGAAGEAHGVGEARVEGSVDEVHGVGEAHGGSASFDAEEIRLGDQTYEWPR